MIYVCAKHEMPDHVRALNPSHLISLVAPCEMPSTPAGFPVEKHLKIAIDDICEAQPGGVLPAVEHVRELIGFLETWAGPQPVIIHCIAGVSRSMAAALIALVAPHPGRELEAARLIRAAAPHAHPNREIIRHADALLGRNGELIAAREAMGDAVAVLHGPLVRLTPFAAERLRRCS